MSSKKVKMFNYNRESLLYVNGVEYYFSLFNKGICIGDSITEGSFNVTNPAEQKHVSISEYSYPHYLTKLSGVEVDNLGISGATSVEWYALYEDIPLEGYDFAIINLGINDVLKNVPLCDTKKAIDNIICKLQGENEGIKILCSTLIPMYTDGVQLFDEVGTLIREIPNSYENVYLVDLELYSCCHKDTVYENGHPSALGYLQIAKEYIEMISSIICVNPEEVRNVQFIGTDYQYYVTTCVKV